AAPGQRRRPPSRATAAATAAAATAAPAIGWWRIRPAAARLLSRPRRARGPRQRRPDALNDRPSPGHRLVAAFERRSPEEHAPRMAPPAPLPGVLPPQGRRA